jgi:phosphoenolpyruvate carboxylase
MLSPGNPAQAEPFTKQKLYDLLDQITDPAVLQLQTRYQAAQDKQAFYAEFETPAADIFQFEKWLHYKWIRLQLAFLGYQKEQLTKRAEYNKLLQANIENQQSTTAVRDAILFNPAIPETVDAVIQRDAIDGVSIQDSIAKLRQIRLQVVGTEHPTDPLGQEAHDILSLIANELAKDEASTTVLLTHLTNLLDTDAIPPVRREVNEEVSRDKEATAFRFYDNLPIFIDRIFSAYSKFYGKQITEEHSATILLALEGGKQPDGTITDPITTDASWAAGDAEGNPNIDPAASSVAVTEIRKKAAMKHSAALKNIRMLTKNHERILREEIPRLHDKKFDCLIKLSKDVDLTALFQRFQRLQTETSLFLISRNFAGLVGYYAQAKQDLLLAIKSAFPEPTTEQQSLIKEILQHYDKQASYAEQLRELTLFSGSYLDKNKKQDNLGEQLSKGEMKSLQIVFQEIAKKVDDDKNSSFLKQNNLAAILQRFDGILTTHSALWTAFPDIYRQMRNFRLQLICFGMGLGYMHIRQDASVLMRVWDDILSDMDLGTPRFLTLAPQEQAKILEDLLDGSKDSREFLETIHTRWKTQHYAGRDEVTRELERLELALNNPDIFELWILSNTANLANILTVVALKKVFPFPASELRVVPLLENLSDLNNAPQLLENYIRILILDEFSQNDQLRHLVNDLRQLPKDQFKFAIAPYKSFITRKVEVMFGYSDSERGSGLSALVTVDRKQAECIKLCKEYGIPFWIFDGSGNDLFRGGSHLARRKAIFTGQGKFRDDEYGTPVTANILRESQFANYYMDLTTGKLDYADLKPVVIQTLDKFCKDSSDFFETFLDTTNGYGGIVGTFFSLIKFIVELGNQSSRGNKRSFVQNGVKQKNHSDPSRDVLVGGKDLPGFEDPGPLRAIGASQLYEMLRLYSNIIIGPGRAMRMLDEDPKRCLAKVKSLYYLSPAFQDIYEKMLYGLAAVKTEITFSACFLGREKEFTPVDEQQRLQWLAEANGYGSKYNRTYVESLLTTTEGKEELLVAGKEELLVALSRVLVLIEDEFLQTRAFLLKANKLIFREKYLNNPLVEFTDNTDLLHHNPELRDHLKEVFNSVEPLNWLLARISNHLKNNRKLDQVYQVSKEMKVLNSKLNIYGSILGDIMCAIASSRTMVLTVDVQRPVVQGRMRMLAEYQQYKAAATLLPAHAESGQTPVRQLLADRRASTFEIPQRVVNSWGLFNEGKLQKDKVNPFTVERNEVANQHRRNSRKG